MAGFEVITEERGRPRKGEGAVYQRDDSQFWQVWYRDQKGEIQRESTSKTDSQAAERFLRDRLDGRDEGRLSPVLTIKQLTFAQWADWFLERRSRPPFRSEGNHQQNLNAMKFLEPVFVALSEITAEAIEDYLAGAVTVGPQGPHQERPGVEGHNKAGNRPSGVSNPLAHAQRDSKTKAIVRQPMSSCRVSGLGCEIDPEAALHDGERAGEDRV